MMTVDEAAIFLRVGKRTLQRYVSNGKIPEEAMSHLPGKILFFKDELQKLMRGGGIK